MKKIIPLQDDKTGLYVYPEDKEANEIDPSYFINLKIITDTKESKEQLLKAIKYIHDLPCIDSDFMSVNSIMHLYLNPDLIEVQENEFTK